MICSDFHLHCSYSPDSDSSMEEMIRAAIGLGLKRMCLTDHQDWDYETDGMVWYFDTDPYVEDYLKYKEKYKGQIELLLGVEMGLQPHLAESYREYVQKYPFDFIIGSSHLAHGKDPYQKNYFEGITEEEGYREYFDSILENIDAFDGYQVYGHLDYVVRYGPNRNKYYSYEAYRDVLDTILMALIDRGLGIEVNTAGYKYGLGQTNPHPDVLKRYKELGGEILTIGSDAHRPEHIAYSFPLLEELLTGCGFRYYTVFRNRKPEFIKIS